MSVSGPDDGPGVTVRADSGTSVTGGTGELGRDRGVGIPDDGDLIPTADEDARCRERTCVKETVSVSASETLEDARDAALSRSNRRRTFFKASPCSRASRRASSVSASFLRSVATILFACARRILIDVGVTLRGTHLFEQRL